MVPLVVLLLLRLVWRDELRVVCFGAACRLLSLMWFVKTRGESGICVINNESQGPNADLHMINCE